MGKHKKKILKRGIPTGEDCEAYTNKCAICGMRRPNQRRIVEHRYESYHCRCRDAEGQQLSTRSPDKVKCVKPAINETTKCYLHGGASLRGEAHPNFKHGRYSKVIPLGLRSAYEQSINDEKLTHLREQLALCDARELELVEQLPEGGIATALAEVTEKTRTMGKLLGEDELDLEAIKKTFGKLRSEIDDIRDNEGTWKKIHSNMEQRRQLAETENRHKERLQGVVLPEQLLHFQAQVIRVLKEVLPDAVALNEAAEKLRSITGGGALQIKAKLEEVVDAEVVAK